MITADTITDEQIRELQYSATFATPVWQAAEDALMDDDICRRHLTARYRRAAARAFLATVLNGRADHEKWVAERFRNGLARKAQS